jgi:site-specific DNA recombinase
MSNPSAGRGAPTPPARPWIVYVRVSDEDQLKGLSLDAQRDACIAFLRSTGAERYEVVEDPGFSAFGDDALMRRPGMRSILERVQRREVAGIIAWKIDRVARDLFDLLTLAKRLKEHDADMMIVVEQVSTSGPNGRFLMQLHGMLAEKSSHDTSVRVKASFAKKVERGEWLGGPIPPGCVVVGDTGRRRLERDPTKGDIVASIWKRVADGATLADIGAYLRAHGLHPYNGSRRRSNEQRKPRVWTRQTVLNLLRSKSVVGVLVDVETRDRALAALGMRFAPGRAAAGAEVVSQAKPSERVWRLARIAHCATCGAALVGVHARGKSGTAYPYLRCSAKVKSRTMCSAPDLPAEAWEAAVIEAVRVAVAEHGPVVEQLGAELKARKVNAAAVLERRGELMRRRDGVRARVDRLAMLVADGDAAADAVRPTLAKLQAEMRAADKALAEAEGELRASEMTAEGLDHLLRTIAGNVDRLAEKVPEHQAAILATLLADVRLGKDHPIRLRIICATDGVFVQPSRVAPRHGRSTNQATVAVDIPVTVRPAPVSARGGWRWEVQVDPAPRPPPAPPEA